MTTAFDPATFKTTTRAQWEAAAEAWDRWGPAIEDWLGEATERMLDDAGLAPGGRVIDVAAGAGGQTLAAARRVGVTGQVLATDISPGILEYAAANASRTGLGNVRRSRRTGRTCRRSDRRRTTQRSRAWVSSTSPTSSGPSPRSAGWCARAGGSPRSSTPLPTATASSRSRWGSSAASPACPHRHQGCPAPSAWVAPGVAEAAYAAAGLVDVTVTPVPSPVRLESAAECVRFEQESFGALHQMLSGVDDRERAAAWTEIHEELSRFDTDEGFVGPCEMLVVSGTRP